MKLRENTTIVVVVTLEVVTADKKSQFVGKLLFSRPTDIIHLTDFKLLQEYRHSWPDTATYLCVSILLPRRDDSTKQPSSLFYSHSSSLRLLPPLSPLFHSPFLLFPFSLFFSFYLFFLLFLSFLLLFLFFFFSFLCSPPSFSFFLFLSSLFFPFFSFLSFSFSFSFPSLSFSPFPFSLFPRRQRNFTDNILTSGGGGGEGVSHTPFGDAPVSNFISHAKHNTRIIISHKNMQWNDKYNGKSTRKEELTWSRAGWSVSSSVAVFTIQCVPEKTKPRSIDVLS